LDPGGSRPFVPDGFDPPLSLETPDFVLEPLGSEHNERDYEAWTTSIAHIRGTPGWGRGLRGDGWPYPLTLDENRAELAEHASEFEARSAFAYTVLEPSTGAVIGCVYVDPSEDDAHDACVRSWVRASRAELDVPLWRAVSSWLATDWPFVAVEYATREGPRS
jgi:hypothetical protein